MGRLERTLAALRTPRTYPERTRRVTVVETHFAWVFLTERFAYKLKKPARQAGMDYRTLAARETGCRAELRLNHPLAPAIYLDVVPLNARPDGLLRMGGTGRVVDWLVRMRRLPARAMLDRQLRAAPPTAAVLEALARLLADFHARADRVAFAPARYLARLERRMTENRAGLAEFGARVDQRLAGRVADWHRRMLDEAAGIIGPRGAHVVDGHGDLRAEHVCLGPLAVIDRLEFDRDLRLLDPHEDLALLALEIERAGHGEAGRRLLARAGALRQDPIPALLTHIYMCQRAFTRARLAAWHLADPRYAGDARWVIRTESLLRSAERHMMLARAARGPRLNRDPRPVESARATRSRAGA
jgi:aminoglycoside phosphotransferase family enzyme